MKEYPNLKKYILVSLALALVLTFSSCSLSKDTLKKGTSEAKISAIISEHIKDVVISEKKLPNGNTLQVFSASNDEAASLFGLDVLKNAPEIKEVQIEVHDGSVVFTGIVTKLPSYIKSTDFRSKKKALKDINKILRKMGISRSGQCGVSYSDKNNKDTYIYDVQSISEDDRPVLSVSLGAPLKDTVYIEPSGTGGYIPGVIE